MATLPQWIEARVIQKIATEAEWNAITLVPYKGEFCIVGDNSGKVYNIKVGDGVNTFPNLDYMFDSIQQNVGYIAIESNALPTPEGDVAWGMVTGGTYTFGGDDAFTVPDGHWGIANYSSGAWSFVDMGDLPEYEATGTIAIGQQKAASGERTYLDLFDTGQKDLKAILLNKGKLYPFKNYWTDSDTTRLRLRKAILDVVLYANNTDEFNYVISQISVNSSGSGNRIDVRRKLKNGTTSADFSFRTVGSSVNNSPQNNTELNKLSSGNLEIVTLVPADNSFKIEIITDTSEFANPEQINNYQTGWEDFVFEDSVYRKYELSDVSAEVDDISNRMPVKFENTGIELTRVGEAILKSNGEYYNSSGGSATEKYVIDRDEDLYVSARMLSNSATIVAFYDEEGNFIGTQYPSNNSNFYIERGNIEYPDGAYYVAFSTYAYPGFKVEKSSPDVAASQSELQDLQTELNITNNNVSSLDVRVTDLEDGSSQKTAKAINWQAKVDARRNQLQGEYLQKILADPNYQPVTYGVRWNEDTSNPQTVERLGDLALHNALTGLPMQKMMRSCIFKNGKVQYYLHPNNSNLKEDGSPAVLDGTDGDVMVEIPEIFAKTTDDPTNGVIKELWISPEGIPGYRYYPKFYVAKYYSTVNRDSESLASVCSVNFSKDTGEVYIEDENKYIESDNTGFSLGVQDVYEIDSYASNASTYRGNVNDSTLDGETNPTSQNYARNNLGRPVANINRRTARGFADNAGGVIQQYDAYKVIYYLATVEYATRDLQQPVISELDANGFRQGGLGWGATCYPDYAAYEKYFSPQGGTSVMPNGVTNELGNNSGEVYYRIKNVPVESDGATGGNAVYNRWGDVLMPVNCYRGLESYYGQLYDIVDNVDVLIDGLTYPLKRVHYFYQPNPYLTNDTDDKSDYIFEGSYEFNSSIHVVKHLKWGYNGHVFPVGVGSNAAAAYLTFYACASELTQAWNGNIATLFKYINFGGRAVSKTLVDRLFIVGVIDVSSNRARTSDTVRLQFFGI